MTNLEIIEKLMKNNQKIIDNITEGKKINIEKSIKACLLSNTTLCGVVRSLEYRMCSLENSSRSKSVGDNKFNNKFDGNFESFFEDLMK